LSNYFNHHQKPLSDALYRMADEYLFVATGEMREERKQLGYHQPDAPYVVKTTADSVSPAVRKAIDDADAVIIGSAPEELIRGRLKDKKLTFRYSERLFKQKISAAKRLCWMARWRKNNPQNSELYLLCASAYSAADFAEFGLFRGKAFRWGYFPETKRYDDVDALFDKKESTRLLWVGRFLEWKHPELAVKAVGRLIEKGFDITLDMIGSGGLEQQLRVMIRENHLENRIRLLGSLPYEDVREHMEHAAILLFTSNRQEGWGAVLNEAMNSGCAAVVSHSIGSAPFLIKNGVNGCVFEESNIEMLCDRLEVLLTHDDERRQIGVNAYHTIVDMWNAENAAKRLIGLITSLKEGRGSEKLFEDGPCSRAKLLKDSWKEWYE